MAATRTELFLHIGGVCDGTMVPVEVDEHGIPVEFHTVHSMPDFNPATINLLAPVASQQVLNLYDRDTDLGDEGVRYVFRYRGTEIVGDVPKAA